MMHLGIRLPLLGVALAAAALIFSSDLSSRASHDPSVTAVISGDTNPLNHGPGGGNPNPNSANEGNFFVNDNVQNDQWDPNVQADPNAVGMRMGPIDECSVVSWTDPNNHVFFVDFVIQNVTDMVGYQVRVNFNDDWVDFLGTYDFAALDFGGATDSFGDGFLPYRDRRTSGLAEAVSFVNMIPESQTAGSGPNDGHRSTIPGSAADVGTVLLGDVYGLPRSAAISSDTPSAQAPEGGLLVRTAWSLTAGSDGQVVNFHIAADTAAGGAGPNPGSKVLVFDPANPTGHIEHIVPESHLRDFSIASDGPGPSTPACPQSPLSDMDSDGWSGGAESSIGTDPLDGCADNTADDAHPADFNNDTFFDMTDVGAVAGSFGEPVATATARKDIAPDLPDGFVDITDVGAVAGRFGMGCGP